MLTKIKSFLAIRAENKELNRAVFKALSGLVPAMHAIVLINAVALSWVHWNIAPLWLVLAMPIVIASALITKFSQFFCHRNRRYSDEEIRKRLQLNVYFTIGFSTFTVIWLLLLMEHSSDVLNGQVIFFAGVTTLVVAFCMMHLRAAAMSSIVIVVPPIVVYLLITGDLVERNIAINMFAFSALALLIIRRVNKDFHQLVVQQMVQREQRKRLQELNVDNMQLANTDSLTGLPNRRFFYQTLDQHILSASREKSEFVVILLDLDGFKPVNDVFGHPAGDTLLRAVSDRLKARLGANASLARLGGDEFGIILDNPGDNECVLQLCQELAATLRVPFQLKEGVANIAGTMGVARYPDHGKSRGQLFDRADYALCYSKQHSKGEPIFFSETHEDAIRKEAKLEQRLREADFENELYMVFQPIMDVQEDRVVAFEALARWRSPELGEVNPEVFIKTAEQSGMISKLSLILLKKSLAAAKHWPEDVALSFNLSAINLASTGSVRELIHLVSSAGLNPQQIIFEITESAVMHDFDRVIESLRLLRDTGVKIALDDFGTGFSSLSYVQKLPLDRIKIDRSFIREIEDNIATRKIVETIAVLCRNLELGCIVEGVETPRQMDLVQRMGLSVVQGFFFAEPLSQPDALAFIDRHNRNDDNIAWLSA